MTGADTRSQYDALAAWYLPVALVVLALVVLALAYPLLRRRGGEPGTRGSNWWLEGGFVAVLAVVAGVLVWRSFAAVERVDAVATKPALTVRIDAAKWRWRFTYPGGVVQSGALPTLVVPAGVPVRFELRAADVVHAFWVPAVRYKYDAIPGRVNVFDIAFPPELDYTLGGRCSEFCGQYHEDMRFAVDVRSPDAFAAWLHERQAALR